jgi:hypothetical protein
MKRWLHWNKDCPLNFKPRNDDMGSRVQSGNKPVPPRWQFRPDIPTHDFFAGMSLGDTWGLQEAVDDFVYDVEEKTFLTWEAVACHEQGLPLTVDQEELLDDLINFGDPADDRVLYLNDIPRTSEPWYVILNKIVPHLLTEPFVTSDVHDEVKLEGWGRITKALSQHGKGLSLPPEVSSVEEVVPAELRHKLWLQFCFDPLDGLGQSPELTLEDEEEHYRLVELIDRLRSHKDSVAYLDLTLASLLSRVILPDRDLPIFVEQAQQRLGVRSDHDRIVEYL